MAQRKVLEMAADELWEEWRNDIERIRQDIHELFSSRRTFRDVADVFRKNGRLQAVGGHLWDWMRVSYASYVVMRVRRETDEQGNTVNLNQLLREIEQRPNVVTRERFIAMLNIEEERELLKRINQEYFTKTWMTVDSPASTNPTDRLDPARVKSYRDAFQDAVERMS